MRLFAIIIKPEQSEHILNKMSRFTFPARTVEVRSPMMTSFSRARDSIVFFLLCCETFGQKLKFTFVSFYYSSWDATGRSDIDSLSPFHNLIYIFHENYDVESPLGAIIIFYFDSEPSGSLLSPSFAVLFRFDFRRM